MLAGGLLDGGVDSGIGGEGRGGGIRTGRAGENRGGGDAADEAAGAAVDADVRSDGWLSCRARGGLADGDRSIGTGSGGGGEEYAEETILKQFVQNIRQSQ
jgi:hypothetical protein